MAIEKSIVEYKEFGKCARIANGEIELFVTLDIGPRIIRFGFIGGKNELCEAPNQTSPTPHGTWHMLGGHRLWTSPESVEATYTIDDQPVSYEFTDNGVKVVSVVYDNCKVQKEFVIEMCPESNKVKVVNNLYNRNPWDVEFAAWALTVMAPGGVSVLPQNTQDTGLLHNRNLVIWSYTKINDDRLTFGDKHIIFRQDPNKDYACKIGFNADAGWATYINDGVMFVKKFDVVKGATYPDAQCSYETYTIDFMMELESLSPLQKVAPDGHVCLTENWELHKDVAFDGTLAGAEALEAKYI